jgi:RHS repeat-associated protein
MPSHAVEAGATRAALPTSRRMPRRPPGAVAERVHVVPLTQPRFAPPTIRNVRVARVGARASGVRSGASLELPAQRTATSRVFRNPDGSVTRRLYAGQVNVQKPGGDWSPLDLRLATAGSGRLAPRAAPRQATFGPVATDPELASLLFDAGHSVAFGLQGATSVRAVASGPWATYPRVRRDADLRLAATGAGLKEDLVLRSADAPTSYQFPLHLVGLRPALDSATGALRLLDENGTAYGVIPPGSMADSAAGTRTGLGATSNGVRYTLAKTGAGGWSLRVDLDAGWLHDPHRVFPVTVDPSLTINADADDTFVMSNSPGDNSGAIDLDVGTPDGGGHVAASYLHVSGLVSQLRNQYILGATLNLIDIWSASCTPSPVSLYAVTGTWSGSGLRSWPGAPLGQLLSQRSFAHGHDAGCAAAREGFTVSSDQATRWTHGEPFYGFSLRASGTDSNGWKRFASANVPTAANVPYLDVTYSPEGASFDVTRVVLPVATQQGAITLNLTNQGSATWAANGPYRLGVIVKQSSSVINAARYPLTTTLGPGAATSMQVPLPALTPGDYDVYLTMYDASGRDFNSAYGVPYGVFHLPVHNVAPAVNFQQPPNGGVVDSIMPTLYGEGTDPDKFPGTGLTFDFKICDGTPDSPTACQESGWTGNTWTPPRGALRWSHTYYWWVKADDGIDPGPFVGPLALTTWVPQPGITSHLPSGPGSLAGGVNAAEAPGLDPQVGNYSAAATDSSISTAGPDLTITRTYNSLDWRRDTAFGIGWSSRLDTRVAKDNDGSGNVVVTLPSGRQARFGANDDGSYAAPPGVQATLVYDSSSGVYTLRDASGTTWSFDAIGRLVKITDGAGLSEHLTYDVDDHVRSIVNDTSGRGLTIIWSGGHVTRIDEPVPAAGTAAPSWAYSYDGDRLTSVCAPGAGSKCTHYTYQTGSHYRSTVLDDNPRGYWRLGETSGDQVSSVTARNPGADAGTYTNVQLGTDGALAGTVDKAATFDGLSAYVTLPDKLATSSMSLAVELWFKTTNGGVLLSYQDQPFPSGSPSLWTPVLYVGIDGLLRGAFWMPHPQSGQVVSSQARVDDGNWHHAVLSAAVDAQTLYLDGVAQGTVRGAIDHDQQVYLTLGSGNTRNWPAGSQVSRDYYFGGSIDEVAIYEHPLGPPAVQRHYQAGRQTVDELTQITWPQDNRVYAKVTYDDLTDRASSLTDQQGRAWTLHPPTVSDGTRRVVLNGAFGDWTYTFDVDHSGRLMSRSHNGGTRSLEYNAAGFPSSVTDESGHRTIVTTDARGNVLSRTTCRASGSCNTAYFTYFLNAQDPLDPRNDRLLTTSDARSSGPADMTYRTTYDYDTAGRLLSRTYPVLAGQTARPEESWAYSTGDETAAGGGKVPAGLLVRATGRRGQVTTHSYTAAGDLDETVSPTGLRTRCSYDALGRVRSVTTANSGGVAFGTTSYTYTPRSQVDTVTEPAVTNPLTNVRHTKVTTHGYDADGNVTLVTVSDATGGDPSRATTYTYDANDRLTGTTYPDGTRLTRRYDKDGFDVTVTDAAGTAWRFMYDDQGRLLWRAADGPAVDPQDAGATSITLESRSYDPAGRLASVRDAIGRQMDYTYFDDGLLATRTLKNFHNPDGSVRGDVLVEQRTYDPAGNLTRLVTAGGRTSTVTYDPAGYIASTRVDPDGLNRATTYTRDADGNPAQVTRTGSADPRRTEQTTFGYDEGGLLSRQDDTLVPGFTVSTQYRRDERGLVTQVLDQRLNATGYAYDPAGQLVSVTGPAVDTWVAGQQRSGVHPVQTIGRNTFGEVTQTRDENGALFSTTRDSMGRVSEVTLPDYQPPGGSTIHATSRIDYDPLGRPATLTDPLGRVTTTSYDPYGRPRTRSLPATGDAGPSVTSFTYDRDGELRSQTGPTGATTSYTYDDLGRQLTQTDVERYPGPATPFTMTTTYDDAGDPLSVSSPLGHTATARYDAVGEPLTMTDPTGRVTTFAYDDRGRLSSVTDPSGLVTRTTYDLLGRPTTVAQLAGSPAQQLRNWQYDYDDVGDLTAKVSPEGRRTAYAYDPLNRPVRVDEKPDAATTISTTLGYDAAGNRTRLVDGERHATDSTYTPWGLPESTIEPATASNPDAADRTWTTVYDAAGQPSSQVVPGGVVRTRKFDAQGHLIGETGTGAEPTTADRTLGYDPAGRLTSIATPSGTTTYRYDDRGHLVEAHGASGEASFVYDGDGLLARRTDAVGTATFGYDDAGRLTRLTDPLTGRTVNSSYDSAGRLAVMNDPAAGTMINRATAYDALGRVTSDNLQDTSDPGVPPRVLLGTAYGYDLDGNITAKTTTNKVTGSARNTYSYDGAGRLASWTAPNGTATSYGWDAAGNRIKSGSTIYTYNERNQLVSGGGSYAYTPRGTLSSISAQGATRQLTFDAFDRLVGDGATSYAYDSLDRVASRNGVIFQYPDTGNDVVADGARLVSRGPQGAPVADRAAAATTQARMLYADQHGDITGRYLGSSVLDTRSFDPFGMVTGSTGQTPSLAYQGSWTDPDTGAVDMAARWYLPSTGAFASRDSLTLDPVNSSTANRYLYGAANPIANTDPSGHALVSTDDGGGGQTIVFEPAPLISLPPANQWPVIGGLTLLVGAVGSGLAYWIHGGGSSSGSLPRTRVCDCPRDLPATRDVPAGANPPLGGGAGPRSGEWVPPRPPPPPRWVINALTSIPRAAPGATVVAAPLAVPAAGPSTVWIDPGPQLTRDATRRTECAQTGCALPNATSPVPPPNGSGVDECAVTAVDNAAQIIANELTNQMNGDPYQQTDPQVQIPDTCVRETRGHGADSRTLLADVAEHEAKTVAMQAAQSLAQEFGPDIARAALEAEVEAARLTASGFTQALNQSLLTPRDLPFSGVLRAAPGVLGAANARVLQANVRVLRVTAGVLGAANARVLRANLQVARFTTTAIGAASERVGRCPVPSLAQSLPGWAGDTGGFLSCVAH